MTARLAHISKPTPRRRRVGAACAAGQLIKTSFRASLRYAAKAPRPRYGPHCVKALHYDCDYFETTGSA